jgi:WD40 repeat protein
VARFSPNGEWVASGDVSGTVRVWARNEDRTLRFEIRALSGSIDDLDWSPDGQRIVVCGDGKGSTFVKAFLYDISHSQSCSVMTLLVTKSFMQLDCIPPSLE